MSEEGYRRRLAALLSADVEGYSRLMREDEDTTIRTVTEYRNVIIDLIRRYRGRVVDSPGDNVLAEFGSVVDAVNCAVEVQRDLAERNLELAEKRRMKWRIGVNLGDVVQDGERIYGDGVNVAARMESLAEGGGICLSGTVFDAIENKIGLEYEYLGEQEVKNIPKPIRAYRVLSHPGDAAHRVLKARKAASKRWRSLVAAAAAVLIVAAAVAVMQYSFRSPPQKPPAPQVKALPLPDKPSIAVLPFANTSGDPKQDYLSDGITDQLIYALSRVPGLFVIARQSSFFYKGKKVEVRQVGRELGVKYVLEGNVDRSGDRLRITAQLIDAQTGRHLWAERYDRKLKDIFAVQDAITLKVVNAVFVGTSYSWKALDTYLGKGTRNFEALVANLKAEAYCRQGNAETNIQAIRFARRAIALDPQYPAPYARLAIDIAKDLWLGTSRSPRKSLQKAVELCQKALALDKTNPDANSYLAFVYAWQGRPQKALEQAERAIAFNPNWPDAHFAKGMALFYMGKPKQALSAMKKAIRLNPEGPSVFFVYLGYAYMAIKQYEKALTAFKKAVSQAPNYYANHLGLVYCYVKTGRMKLARAEAAEVLRLKPDFSVAWFEKANAVPNKNRASNKRFSDVLRKAGLK